jgi:hypothetical protein
VVQLKEFKGENDMYQIFIDSFYNGGLDKRGGVWVALVNPSSWLQGIDAELMGEVFDSSEA